ncbi:MAG TPA: polysaccharide biosynthesis/export family protein [Bryobacteraceae bacterium]|jgi:protein involved in polysaccharide export with SLBB domain
MELIYFFSPPYLAAPAFNALSYVLGPEDQISIHAVALEDVPDKPVRVDPNGFIDLPLAGRIHVAGLTVEQFRGALTASLAKYIGATEPEQIPVNLQMILAGQSPDVVLRPNDVLFVPNNVSGPA